MSGSATLAEQAREALRTLIGDGPLRLIADAEPADAGGRLLRHVYRADRLLAADLARQGWVRALPIPPNLAEREASTAPSPRPAPPLAAFGRLMLAVSRCPSTRSRKS